MTVKKLIFEGATPIRLDLFLAQKLELSRGRIRTLINDNKIQVNKQLAKAGYFLEKGDEITIPNPQLATEVRPELAKESKQSLEVVFEDQHLLVVNKPRGMHSVVLNINDDLSLADLIAFHSKDCIRASDDQREAGLVNRLDYWTSGLLIAARSKDIWCKLHQSLFQKEIQKKYLALVEGSFPTSPQEITFDIQQNKRKVVKVLKEQTLPQEYAPTKAKLQKLTSNNTSLIEVNGARFKRHQIRAHLSALGHPLIGDSLYKSQSTLQSISPKLPKEGFLLHASQITLTHPITNKTLSLSAKFPELNLL